MNPFLSELRKPQPYETGPDAIRRVCSAEETLAKVRPFFPQFGITRIAPITGLDKIGIPCVAVVRPAARSLAVSLGKGVSLAAAKTSGVMEAIELYHGEHASVHLVYESEADLGREHRVASTKTIPKTKSSRYLEDCPILWTASVNICTGNSVYVPFEVVHANALVPAPGGSGCFLSTSNGLSSGNTLGEAVLHGLCEVVERDATALWEVRSAEEKRNSFIDLDSTSSIIRRLVADCEAANMDVALWDTTSDIGIPAFLCEIVERDNPNRKITAFTGMGCSVSRESAAIRAITEAAQCRLALIAGSRDDLYREEYASDADGLRKNGRYTEFSTSKGKAFCDVQDHATQDISSDIQVCQSLLTGAGFDELLVIDLSKPKFQVPVVRVVIPGLEGPDDEPDCEPGERVSAILSGDA